MNNSAETSPSTSPAKPVAVGLVHRPSGTPGPDRSWARSLVVRHARAQGLTLLHVYELDDDEARNADVLRRLADTAAHAHVTVLVTDGLDVTTARGLAGDLGLRHSPVPSAPERGDPW
jgi:thiamine monophosphate synthase